jgi:hypothetical protein
MGLLPFPPEVQVLLGAMVGLALLLLAGAVWRTMR